MCGLGFTVCANRSICFVIIWDNMTLQQHDHHFVNDILKFISFNQNCCIFIHISLKCMPKGVINNKPALI